MKDQDNINIMESSKKDYDIYIEAVDINSVLTIPNLGSIGGQGEEPTETLIKTHIAIKNKDVNISYVLVNGITQTNAIITGMAPIYYGSVKVTYSIGVVPITQDLTTPNLGDIFTTERPTVEQIKTALKNNGINPNLEIDAVTIQNITAANAKVIGNGTRYSGEETVSFTIKKLQELSGWTSGTINALTVNANGLFIGTYVSESNNKYSGRIFKSIDNGRSFTEMSGTVGGILSLVSDKDGNVYVAAQVDANTGKVYATSDASHFAKIDGIDEQDGLVSFTLPTYLNVDLQGEYVYATVKLRHWGFNYAEIYKSKGTGKFSRIGNDWFGDGGGYSVAIDHYGTVFAGTRTENGKGELFKLAPGVPKFTKVSGITAEVRSLVSNKDGRIFIGTRTSDGSSSVYWSSTNNNSSFIQLSGTTGTIYNLTADTLGNVYAGTRTGAGTGGCFKSSGGSNFSVISGSTGAVYGIAFDSEHGVFYIGTTLPNGIGKLYKSI